MIRITIITLCIASLFSCSKEEVSVADGNWTRYIYERSDIASIEINSSSNPTIAFRNNFYQILGNEGDLVADPKQSLPEFENLKGVFANPLFQNNFHVFAGKETTDVNPVFGLKLMDINLQARSFYHQNVDNGIFFNGNRDSFFGIVKSPTYTDGIDPSVDFSFYEYDFSTANIDTINSYHFTSVIDPSGSSEFKGVRDDSVVYFSFQSTIYRYDSSNGSLISEDTEGIISNIDWLDNELFVNRLGFLVDTYDGNLDITGTLDLSVTLPFGSELKVSPLNISTEGNSIYATVAVSSIDETSPNFLSEVALSVELVQFDANGNYQNKYEVLSGLGKTDVLPWEKYDLVSMDVQTGAFAVFLFQREIANSKFEYLVKRVNFF